MGSLEGNRLKAVVFDWDLTLWNSWDLHLQLMQSTADALSLPRPSGAQVAREYHRPFFQHLTWFFGDDEQRVVDTYMVFYLDSMATVGGLYPGVPETLVALKDRGYRIALFSDKRQQFGELEVELSGIGHLLDYTLFLVEGRPYKPDPHGLLHVLDVLGVAKDEAVYVGDGSHDLECARRAGVAGGAALWGSLNREDLLNGHPDHSWESMDQVLLSLE